MNSSEKNHAKVKLVECPRDAMQGWKSFIPSEKKVAYLNALLEVGFDTIDCGSFVSPKAIPQMADTGQVISQLQTRNSKSKLLVIVANVRGAEEASRYDQISYLGFPFSVSETFQQRNTNSTIEQSFSRVTEVNAICKKNKKQLVVYISMGFGNPYGDTYSEQIVFEWVSKITALGINIISLADTVGLATPQQVFKVTDYLVRNMPEQEIGVHLHSTPDNWQTKIDAALKAGCNRLDGSLKGIGGCPMADDALVGNMNTEWMIPYLQEMGLLQAINTEALRKSLAIAAEIFI